MLEILSDKEILQEYTLGEMKRYNNTFTISRESVAEHTCFVTLFCLKIISKLTPKLNDESQLKILKYAALHDVPESVTSDIPHNVKERFPLIKEILRIAEADYYNDNWKFYADDISFLTDFELSIVELADAYSVMQYSLNEIDRLGNNSNEMSNIYHDSLKRVTRLTNKINDTIKQKGEKLKCQ